MQKMRKLWRLDLSRMANAGLISFFIFLLVACGPPVDTDPIASVVDEPVNKITLEESSPVQGADESVAEEGYPGQMVEESTAVEGYPGQMAEESTAENAYPVGPLPLPEPTIDPQNYPPPALEESFSDFSFRFDLPLNAGDTLVTGQAPPNLSLAIVDVTFNGILGIGVSDADGRFSIGVQELLDGHRVGITFSELQPGKTHADMSEEYFPHRGEGFINIPNIGIFFDSALVES